MTSVLNILFGGQPENLEYIGYGDCPQCGDDCAEFWRDKETGKTYVRCPYIMCDGWHKLMEVDNAD
jgi:hypothetical protein